MSAGDAFSPLRSALEKAGVRCAIGGSLASTTFGEPRFTNGVDILADFTQENLDPAEARNATHLGRPFNVIYMPMAFKFDFFPASAFPLGFEELDRPPSWRKVAFPKPPSRLSHRRTFCLPNCTGSAPGMKYPRCSGAISRASSGVAARLWTGYISSKVPGSSGW
jgi:hypothetical protein